MTHGLPVLAPAATALVKSAVSLGGGGGGCCTNGGVYGSGVATIFTLLPSSSHAFSACGRLTPDMLKLSVHIPMQWHDVQVSTNAPCLDAGSSAGAAAASHCSWNDFTTAKCPASQP